MSAKSRKDAVTKAPDGSKQDQGGYAPYWEDRMIFEGTTICLVKRSENDICIAGDGQVTFGQSTIMKSTAKKVRKIYKNSVLVGFAGSVADAFTLTEKFEKKLEEHQGNLKRAAVALAQEWRGDRVLRKLEALMLVADKADMLLLSGNGEVIEPDDQVVAIGSGGNFAMSAAKALYHNTELSAEKIARKSLEIAASICVYTNDNITIERLQSAEKAQSDEAASPVKQLPPGEVSSPAKQLPPDEVQQEVEK